MPAPYSVALLGFSPFERNTLASYFRLATHRSPSYSLVQTLSAPDFMVADADHGPSVQLALAEDLLARTVFIGTQAPAGATAWMRRPIDPLHVMRELDAMVPLLAAPAAPPDKPPPEPEARAHADAPEDALLTLAVRAPGTSRSGAVNKPVQGQRTVALPRRSRRGTIEEAFEGDKSSLPRQTALAPPGQGGASRADDAEGTGARDTSAEAQHGHRPPAARPADADRPPSARRPATAPEPSTYLPPPRALLVDDSDLARHFLARLLEPWGVVCDQAPSSQQALHCLTEHDYDCIFLDLELGANSDQDGLSLCQHIKRLHSSVQVALATVVMVSAHHSESDRVRGSLAGCDAYLGKPLKHDELQHLLLRLGLKPPAGVTARTQGARPA